MIFVTLGTQDKPFKRLLDYLENSSIDEEIIVQAGYTKYLSKKMKIFDYLTYDDYLKYLKQANIVITHGGVGTLISCLKEKKKIIACARLSKYGEHQNDHQKQIVRQFKDDGYLLEVNEDNDINDLYKRIQNFKPKEYVSNNENFCSKLEAYIDQ